MPAAPRTWFGAGKKSDGRFGVGGRGLGVGLGLAAHSPAFLADRRAGLSSWLRGLATLLEFGTLPAGAAAALRQFLDVD